MNNQVACTKKYSASPPEKGDHIVHTEITADPGPCHKDPLPDVEPERPNVSKF